MTPETNDVLAHLVADLRPVRRLASPSRRAAAWLVAATAIIGVAVVWNGLRPDLGERLALPYDVGQWLASVATGVLAALAAFMVALPDRSQRWALLPLPALAAWVSTLGWGCLADVSRLGPQARTIGTSWGCLQFIVGLGLPLLGSMLWVLRHAAPVRPMPVALLGSLAAAALCSAGLTLFHHLDAALMVFLWHGGAAAVVIALGAMFGRMAYRR